MTSPLPIPLAAPLGTRFQSLSVDARIINGFVDQNARTGEVHVYKRPGFSLRSSAIPAGTAYGIFNWDGNIYAIVGSTMYRNGVALTGTINTAGGPYTFEPGLGATPRLFFHNTTKGYTVTAAGNPVAVSNGNFPPNQVPALTMAPGSVYLNQKFFVGTTTAGLYNSATSPGDDPTTWEAGFINASSEGAVLRAIGKQLVYIVAFKDYFSEAFYDAGNPAPGSPLGPVQGAKMNFGIKDARTLCNCGGELLFVSQTREGSIAVVRITALSAEVVSTPQVERILEAASYTTVYSWSVKTEGHRLYGLTLPASNLTLVYDITTGYWYQWTDTNGNYLPYAFSTVDTNGKAVFLHESNGKTFNLDGLVFQDDGALFSTEIYTPNLAQDAQTKIAGRLDLVADRVATSTCELRWSDDDYQTWSTPVVLDLSLERPSVSDMGSFYRRAFHLKHRANTSFRVERAVILTAKGA